MTATVPAEDGIHLYVPDDSYHDDRASLSVSGAKLLLPPSCPSKFRQHMDNPQKPKRAYDFGHLTHKMILGKGAEFAFLDPAVHGLTKDGKVSGTPRATAGWKAAESKAREQGLTPMHIDDLASAEAIAQRVFNHPAASERLAEGTAEVSLYYTDPETGVRLRGRLDWVEPNGDIDDVKTSITANPAELERRFWQLNYHMQAAWYIDLAIAVGAAEDPVFRFIVIEKTPPFEPVVVQLDQDAIDEGRRQNRRAIRLYANCMEDGQWPGYSDIEVTIGLPRWVKHEATQHVAEELIAELEGLYT